MAAKARLAIVGGVAAVVAVLAVYALVAGIQGSTNGISVNEEKRGKGTVETLEFKNPVTIRLIDKDGNVASETVVYNDITAGGRAYIYQVLGNPDATVAALNFIRFVDDDGPTTDAFQGPGDDGLVSVTDAAVDCDPSIIGDGVDCIATFTFAGSGYTPSTTGNLTLYTGVRIQTGYYSGPTWTPYFELTSIDPIAVNDNTTYTEIQIKWQITVS